MGTQLEGTRTTPVRSKKQKARNRAVKPREEDGSGVRCSGEDSGSRPVLGLMTAQTNECGRSQPAKLTRRLSSWTFKSRDRTEREAPRDDSHSFIPQTLT